MRYCKRPPEGWSCLRFEGHTGPCAAVPEGDPEAEFMPDPAHTQPPLVPHDQAYYQGLMLGTTIIGLVMFALGVLTGVML